MSVLTDVEKDLLCSVLLEFHEVFSLEKGECGETDLVELHIDTGEAEPKRQQGRHEVFSLEKGECGGTDLVE